MSKNLEPSEIVRNGSASRVLLTLLFHPERDRGLTLEELSELTGLTRSTTYCNAVQKLFRVGLLTKEEIRTDTGKEVRYRLRPDFDIAIDSSLRNRKVRSLEDVVE